MAELTNLRAIVLVDGELTEACVKALESLPHLEYLNMGPFEGLNDENIGRLAGLTQLKALYMRESNVSDAEVEIFVQIFPNLEELGLCDTAATDKALPHLSRLRNLKKLFLCGENFTSDALEVLSTLDGLAVFVLSDTSIDKKDARRFARQRPEVEVRWFLPGSVESVVLE